jgi:hypothetical protein
VNCENQDQCREMRHQWMKPLHLKGHETHRDFERAERILMIDSEQTRFQSLLNSVICKIQALQRAPV